MSVVLFRWKHLASGHRCILDLVGPRGLRCETNLKKIMGWESYDVFSVGLWPLLQGQGRIAKLKIAYNLLIIHCRGCESSDVGTFDLEPLLQGPMRIAKLTSTYSSLFIGPKGLHCETSILIIMGWEFGQT